MNWLMIDKAAAAGPATPLAVVFSLLLYAALLVTALGLAVWWRRSGNFPKTLAPGQVPEQVNILRKMLDRLALRERLAADPWDWAFRICILYGVTLSLARHLRYVASPDLAGPLWMLVLILQPFGFYAGMVMVAGVLGMCARMLIVPSARSSARPADLVFMSMLLALAASGYAMAWSPTDIVALKAFLAGVITFSPRPIPADLLLLAHIWLGCTLVIVFVCAKGLPSQEAAKRNGLKTALAGAAALALLVPAGFGIASAVNTGLSRPVPSPVKLARGHWSENPTVMIRNHPEFLRSRMLLAVYDGVRSPDNTIERCVTCHSIRDGEGRPIGFEDSRHFCTSCHKKEAVGTDCFQCHKSKPSTEPAPAIKNMNTIKAHLAQWSATK